MAAGRGSRGGGDRVEVLVDVESDLQDARNVANDVTRVLRQQFEKAFEGMADSLSDALRGVAHSAGIREIKESFKDAAGGGRLMHDSLNALEADLGELTKRSAAFKQTIDKRGLNSNLFALYEVELGKLLKLQSDFERDSVRLASNPALREEYNQRRLAIGKALDKEAQTIRDVAHLERSALVVETQRAGAQRLAETRIAGQRLIQQERQTSRARIEVFRAASRQIQFIERQIADGFRGAAKLVIGTLQGVTSGLARIGNVFRRGNADVNDGLRGALLRRESSLSRSFGRQTTEVRTELSKQSRTIEAFNAKASTGVVGAVTGRSQLGSALGLGAGIGGGFALFQGLRSGIKIGGDFVQGLAVLQAQLKLTDAEMAGVRQQSIDLGNDISLPGVSALDAAQAIQILGKQFAVLGEEALPAAQGAARGVLQLARATGVAAEEAARVVGAAVNVFGIDASEAVQVADEVTNAMTNAAGVAFNDFADSFQQASSVFSLFQKPALGAEEALVQFNAALAVLARGGLVGSDAGTSLKSFFIQANRGTKDSEEALGVLAERARAAGGVFFDSSGQARGFAQALDIMRKGLKGLSDQERVHTLQKIFGQDALRAANLLLNTTGIEFNNLTDAIRETGSAADIAAAQNTGFRGALDALRSVIETQQIKTYEKYQGMLGKVTLKFAELLQAFFDGEGRMGTLRVALEGIGAALGTLLVIKVVAEGFSLFATSLRAVGSPLGVVVGGLAALGAAVAVLRHVSPAFRKETDAIADSLKNRLGEGAGALGDALATVSRFMRVEIIPRFVDFGVVVASRVLPVVAQLSRFFTDRVAPVLRNIGDLLVSTVVPAVADLGRTIADKVLPHLKEFVGLVSSVAGSVLPLIQPAIDGFQSLADAISAALDTGDTSSLLPALAALRDGLLATFRNIGAALVEVLGPQLQAVVGFIADQFSPHNLERAVTGVSRVVFRIGETIGKIVSDPRVLAALEGLVVAFTVTAGLAVAGFAKGIIDNLPEITKGLSKQFQFVFNEIFTDGIDYKKIGGFFVIGLASAMVLGATITGFARAFRAPAEKAGIEAAKGFGGAMGRQLRAGLRRNDFAQVFTGGFEKFAVAEAARTAKALESAQVRAAERLRLLAGGKGGLSQAFVGVDGFEDAAGDAVKQIRLVEDQFGKSAVAAGILRGRLQEVFTDVRNIGSGIREAISPPEPLFGGEKVFGRFDILKSSIAGFGRNLGRLVSETLSNVRSIAQGGGQAIGGAILAGMGSILSGQQLGSATSGLQKGLGIGGIVASALFASAATGGNVAVGVAVGTLGLLTAAFTSNAQEAKLASERVAAYVDILERFNSITGASKDLAENLTDALASQLGPAAEKLAGRLADSGVNARSLIQAFSDRQFTPADDFALFNDILGITQDQIARTGLSIQDLVTGIGEGTPPEGLLTRQIDAFKEIFDVFTAKGVDTKAFADLFNFFLTEFGDLKNAASEVDFKEIFNPAKPDIERFRAQVQATNEDINDLAQRRRIRLELQDLTVQQLGLANTKRIAEGIDTAVQNLNERHLSNVNAEIAEVTASLQGARDAAAQALENITGVFGGGIGDELTGAFDSFLQALPGAQEELKKALEANPDIDLFGLTQQASDLRTAFKPILEPLQGLISTAITSGGIDTKEKLAQFFNDVIKPNISDFRVPVEITDETTGEVSVQLKPLDPEVQQFLFDQLQGGLDNKFLTTAFDDLEISNEAATRLQENLDSLQASLQVDIEFSPQQVLAELRALQNLGLFPGALPTLGDIARAQKDARDAAEAEAISRRLPAQTEQLPASAGGGFTIEELNINGVGEPIATGGEVARSLRALAASGGGFTGRIGSTLTSTTKTALSLVTR